MNVAGLQIEFRLDETEAVRGSRTRGRRSRSSGTLIFKSTPWIWKAATLRHAGRLTEARRQLVSTLSMAREKQLGRQID